MGLHLAAHNNLQVLMVGLFGCQSRGQRIDPLLQVSDQVLGVQAWRRVG